MAVSVLRLITLLAMGSNCYAAQYYLSNDVIGGGFNSFFDYQAIADPTHGRVNYVNQATAQSQNLTYASSNHFVIRSDFKTVLNPSGAGRNSVRLKSKAQFSRSVMIFNVRHMPQGCGTWPAIWTVEEVNWPNRGEIDIVEGVNDQGANQAALHTSAGCTIPTNLGQQGTLLQTNCDANANGNSGCGVRFNDARSYGPTFNNNGGGWFAVERTTSSILVWFWSRNNANVPADVRAGGSSVNTEPWGNPVANFPSTQCDIASKFGPHNIIINLTFCGDWAGSVYSSSGCPSTCNDYVNNNPAAFANAYFDFEWLKVYQ